MKKKITIVAIAIIIIFTAFFMLAVFINDTNLPSMVESIHSSVTDIVKGEMINGIFCTLGTSEQISVAVSEISEETEIRVNNAVNLYFNEMIGRTDEYLDWYYSLGGQWSQIGTVLKGAIFSSPTEAVTSMIQNKLTMILNPESDLNSMVNTIMIDAENTIVALSDAIISENEIIRQQGKEYVITLDVTLEDIVKNAAINIGLDPIRTNIGGIIGGIVSGVIVKKVVTKIMMKAVSKLAVKSATKILTPALLGSVCGPIGTATGIIVGVGVDYLTNKVDEALNRADYKAEIVRSIDEEREQVLIEVATYFESKQ